MTGVKPRGDYHEQVDRREVRIAWIVSRIRTGLLVLAMTAATAPAHALDVTTEENAPFNYLDTQQRISGISTEIWIVGLYKGRELITQSGAKNIKPVMTVREVEYYLACSPKTSDATINALMNELQTLQKEGFLKGVTDRYANRLH